MLIVLEESGDWMMMMMREGLGVRESREREEYEIRSRK
jgi:hypothetical protein